jgi:hypothetical protein
LGGINSIYPNVCRLLYRFRSLQKDSFHRSSVRILSFCNNVITLFSMKSPQVISQVISLDESQSMHSTHGESNPCGEVQLSSTDVKSTHAESVHSFDSYERGEQRCKKQSLHSYDCDSHAKVTTVSHIDKGHSYVDTICQPTLDDTEAQRAPTGKSVEPFDATHQEYYVHQKHCSKERRMSSLSMGSARASSRDRFLSLEQYV